MATTIQTHNQPVQLTLFDLDALEKKIRAGLRTFYEVGSAIKQIRDAEGYKLRGYKTLDEYLEKEFGFGLRHGERLIAAAGAVDKVAQLTDGKMPRNEAVSRELNRIITRDDAPKSMKRVESELKKKGTDIAQATAAQVKEAVDKALGVYPTKDDKKPAPADRAGERAGHHAVVAGWAGQAVAQNATQEGDQHKRARAARVRAG